MTARSLSMPSNPGAARAGPSPRRALLVVGVLVLLVLASAGVGRAPTTLAVSGSHSTAVPTLNDSTGSRPASVPEATLDAGTGTSPVSQAFDQRVAETASALAQAGVSPRDVRLPYVGHPAAQMVNGAVVPGYALASSNVSPSYSGTPAPAGLAYYGESDTSGAIEPTSLEASSVVGTLTVNQLTALYVDDNTPDMWGIQLNAVLTNVTLQGTRAYEFWVQNTADYIQHNDTLSFGEDTWNFSSPTASVPGGTSTILSHNHNGSDVLGTYVGEGPFVYAPMPFTVTFYLNSSLTSAGDQECWFNYTVLAAGGIHAAGNYDWIVFNSTNPQDPTTVSLASFEATGTHLDPVGLPNDIEFDFGIGPYDGSTLDVLAANASATLDYCPLTIPSCTPGQFQSIPAAEDFGSTTGETSTGLSLSYAGTTGIATAGPFILRGLWGFSAAAGSAAGSTPVTNAIAISGSPDPASTPPYVFVFLNGSTFVNARFEWTPDVPVWYLAPGTYQYEVMLADYAEQTGTLVVGTSPTRLAVTLPYDSSSGVYTPLWAFSNAQLAGISTSGTGSITSQYHLFNNPTAGCTACGNAPDGNLSANFFSLNGFGFPTFAGILIDGTDAYVDIDHPVSFCVFGFVWGLKSQPTQGPYFYLQIELVLAHHVTLANDPQVGGWPAMYELATLAGLVDASENPFPTANVVVWNSSDNLVMANTFVPAWLVPPYQEKCEGVCPAVACYGCASPDGLLLYGGKNNTIWGNTFRDPPVPGTAPAQLYSGLAEAESGDLIYNNYFSVDNPTVLLPFDIYNNSCPDGFAGDCLPPLPPTYHDTWNVSNQSAANITAVVDGVALSGNILGPNCGNQGGNYWQDYGNSLNPYGKLPFVNVYDYGELLAAFPSGTDPIQSSIRLGGDYVPLTQSECKPGPPAPIWEVLLSPYAILGLVTTSGIILSVVVLLRTVWRIRPAPWLLPPPGGTAGPSAIGGPTTDAATSSGTAEWLAAAPEPTVRERWARRPLGAGLWAGLVILGAYVAVALSALIIFRTSLYQVPTNPSWIPPFNILGPSGAHPFGVLPGLGADLFRALWQATPWDLAIVAGILAIDAVLGWTLGALAGVNEGGILDAVVTFLGDTLGAIPSFFLVVALFAGLATVAPSSTGLPLFVLLFGLVLWPTIARTTRERARLVAREPYLESARASGAGRAYLFFRHILPNSVSPMLAQLPIDVAPIFFVLTIFPWFWDCSGPGGSKGLTYLIASLPPYSPLPAVTFPEWGNLLAVGTCEGLPISTVGTTYWWMVLFPLLAIIILGIGIALVCDGIDKRLNSRHP
ncbi:MAG: thermopsin family protease [Thermoplasmata archaeon]